MRALFACGLGILLAGPCLCGCVAPDTDRAPPIRRVDPLERVSVRVLETRNESPSAQAAGLTAATHALLVQLLERTGRFEAAGAGEQARFVLETSITALRVDAVEEGVIYRDAPAAGARRRALVEMKYRLGDGQRVFLEGDLDGACDVVNRPINAPGEQELRTGAYWNMPFGIATRRCLDKLVRTISDIF
ncbi:MAG: hypothetical protein HY812_13340 [Planctomycetes bacterium]|nr:hypothetical protein [Planctomycetota bacterium]